MIPVILASASPRRKEILNNLGIEFTLLCPNIEEKTNQITADGVVRELSLKKALAAAALLKEQGQEEKDALIIAADTAVVYDMEILGKPKTKKAAEEMLRRLRGKTHFVTTGVTLLYKDKTVTENELTKIHFSDISDQQISRYVASGEPMDKAGAYGIQGFASLWIDRIEGDYFNVVGFPVHRFYQMLDRLGLTLLPGEGIVKK